MISCSGTNYNVASGGTPAVQPPRCSTGTGAGTGSFSSTPFVHVSRSRRGGSSSAELSRPLNFMKVEKGSALVHVGVRVHTYKSTTGDGCSPPALEDQEPSPAAERCARAHASMSQGRALAREEVDILDDSDRTPRHRVSDTPQTARPSQALHELALPPKARATAATIDGQSQKHTQSRAK